MIRAVAEGDWVTRTGGRSKQRLSHERVAIHGPTVRQRSAWSLTVRHIDVRPAGHGRANGPGHRRIPRYITPLR